MTKKAISLDNVFVYFPDCNIEASDPYLVVINDIAELFINKMEEKQTRKPKAKKELLRTTIKSLLTYLIKADYYNKLVAFKKSYKYYYYYKKVEMTNITYHLIMKVYKFLLEHGYVEEIFNPGKRPNLKYFKKRKKVYEDDEKATRIRATNKLRELYKAIENKRGVSLKSKIVNKTYNNITYSIYDMPWKEATESKYEHAIIISITPPKKKEVERLIKNEQLIFLDKKIVIKPPKGIVETKKPKKQIKFLFTPNTYKDIEDIYKSKKFLNKYNKYIKRTEIILPEDTEEMDIE